MYIFVYKFYNSLIFKVYCGETGTKTFEMLQFHKIPKFPIFKKLPDAIQGFDILQYHTIPQNRQIIVYKIVYLKIGLYFVYIHKLSNRDIARSFNSSTILTYGFIAEKSLCPVHFIITSLGIPSCKAVTTNVRRPQ